MIEREGNFSDLVVGDGPPGPDTSGWEVRETRPGDPDHIDDTGLGGSKFIPDDTPQEKLDDLILSMGVDPATVQSVNFAAVPASRREARFTVYSINELGQRLLDSQGKVVTHTIFKAF